MAFRCVFSSAQAWQHLQLYLNVFWCIQQVAAPRAQALTCLIKVFSMQKTEKEFEPDPGPGERKVQRGAGHRGKAVFVQLLISTSVPAKAFTSDLRGTSVSTIFLLKRVCVFNSIHLCFFLLIDITLLQIIDVFWLKFSVLDALSAYNAGQTLLLPSGLACNDGLSR